MRESVIESYLVSQVKKIGGKAIKMIPTYENGIPDRLVLFNGKAIFVELKAPGEEPRKLQVLYARELDLAGFPVSVIDTKAGVDAFIHDLGTAPKPALKFTVPEMPAVTIYSETLEGAIFHAMDLAEEAGISININGITEIP